MIPAGIDDRKMKKVDRCHPGLTGATENGSRSVSSCVDLKEKEPECPEVRAQLREYVGEYIRKINEDDIEGIQGIADDLSGQSDLTEAQIDKEALENLHQSNEKALKELINAGKNAMDRSVLESQLDNSDKDLLEIYKKLNHRLKDKTLNEEEKEMIKTHLKSRATILMRLENMEG